jgi:hypothetical protein
MEKKTVPRLRSINSAVELMKKEDPECQVTACMVRKAIRTGDFKARRVGVKYLIDVDRLVEFFSCQETEED